MTAREQKYHRLKHWRKLFPSLKKVAVDFVTSPKFFFDEQPQW